MARSLHNAAFARGSAWPGSLLPLLLAALVLLPLLGHRALTAWDEGIYAEISREMLAGPAPGSWWVPHFNGTLWFEKPPLALWLTAASIRFFGVTAFAARLPSALAGIALTVTLFRFLRQRFGDSTATAGVLLLLSGFGFQHAARAGETDTLLGLFCFLALAGLAAILEGRPRGWLFFWVAFALALLTKGAAALTLPLTLSALLLTDRRRLLRFSRAFASGIALFCLLALPWHLDLWRRFGPAFLREYLGLHVLSRATLALEGHHTAPWFFLWVLFVSCFPFALLYPISLLATLRPPASGSSPALRVLALFSLLTLVLFSAARTRLPHYIVPVYAPLAALTATWLMPRLRRWTGASRTRQLAAAATLVLLYLAGAALTARPRHLLHSPRLPSGQLTPDNREAATLESRLAGAPGPLPSGPLLLWRADPAAPLTTDAFYSQRLVQPVGLQTVALGAPPSGCASERYTPCPWPWTALPARPALLLADRSLLPALPRGWTFHALFTGRTLAEGVLLPPPAPKAP